MERLVRAGEGAAEGPRERQGHDRDQDPRQGPALANSGTIPERQRVIQIVKKRRCIIIIISNVTQYSDGNLSPC